MCTHPHCGVAHSVWTRVRCSAFVMELRKCTASLDASVAGSATEQRLAALHAAWLDLVAARVRFGSLTPLV